MKNLALTFVLAAFGLFAVTSNVQAQTCTQTLLTDCFGACGNGNLPASVTAPATGSYAVFTSNSLCGSQGLVVDIRVNNKRIRKIVQGSQGVVTFTADAGDVISLNVYNWKTDPDIICVWAGEANTTLCQTN